MSKQKKRRSPILGLAYVICICLLGLQLSDRLRTLRIVPASRQELMATVGNDLIWNPPAQTGPTVTWAELNLIFQQKPYPELPYLPSASNPQLYQQEIAAFRKLTDAFEAATTGKQIAHASGSMTADLAGACYFPLTRAYLFQALQAAAQKKPKLVLDRLLRLASAYRLAIRCRGIGPSAVQCCVGSLMAAVGSRQIRTQLSADDLRRLRESIPPATDSDLGLGDRLRYEFTTSTFPLIQACRDEGTLGAVTLGTGDRWEEFGVGEFDMKATASLAAGLYREAISNVEGGKQNWDRQIDFEGLWVKLPEPSYLTERTPWVERAWDRYQFRREFRSVPNGLGILSLRQAASSLEQAVKNLSSLRSDIEALRKALEAGADRL